MQRPGRVRAGGIDVEARCLGIVAAAELFERAADDEAQHFRLFAAAVNSAHAPVLELDPDLLLERLVESHRPLRIENAVDRHMRGVIAADHLELVEVGPMGGEVMDVAAVLVGDVVAAPAVVLLHDGAHLFGEVHHDVGAALVREPQVEIALVGIGARGGTDDLAEDVERKARLRRVQEIEIAEERDLDPALPLLAPQIDAEGIDDGSEPRGDDEGRALDQRLCLLRNLHEPCRGAHIGREGRAARLGDPIDRLQHTRVEQRIGEHDDMIAGLDRHDLVKVVGALDIARRLGLGIFHRMRQAAARFRFEDVGNRVRNQGHILLHEIGREIGRELDSSDRAAIAGSLGHFPRRGR